FIADRLASEIAFEDLAHASGVARLRGERRAGDMRRHAVVWHRPPRMVFRSWLRKPNVARVARELAGFERTRNRVAVAELAARRFDEISASLEVLEGVLVDHMLRFGVQRAVQRHYIANLC